MKESVMAAPIPQPAIMDIDLYQGGKSHVAGVANVIKLSSNENPFGPSANAVEAARAGAADLHRYPSSDHGALREAISDVTGLDPDRIICGAGSDEIIAFLCQAFVGVGDEVIHTEHGFAMYRISTLGAGGTPVEVAERERVTDVDAILAAITDRTKMVFIANPNNPTATMISTAELGRLADGVPDDVVLVLDGAYAEYVEGYDGGAALIDGRQNVVMTRTFSKLYGLGGARVGWAYAPRAIIDVLHRLRGPFNVSATALAAAEAAMRDQKYVTWCLGENARLRAMLAEGLAALGVASDTSCANFILARFANAAEAQSADAFLQSRGILVRGVAGYNLPQALRITVGDEPSCRAVIDAIRDFKGAV
jgi:histidinol-phosphate aminotransferase